MYLLQQINYHCKHQLSLAEQYSLGIHLTEYLLLELLDMEDLLKSANSKKLSSWPTWKKEDRAFHRHNKGAPKSRVHKITDLEDAAHLDHLAASHSRLDISGKTSFPLFS